jgi:hypothetical protein
MVRRARVQDGTVAAPAPSPPPGPPVAQVDALLAGLGLGSEAGRLLVHVACQVAWRLDAIERAAVKGPVVDPHYTLRRAKLREVLHEVFATKREPTVTHTLLTSGRMAGENRSLGGSTRRPTERRVSSARESLTRRPEEASWLDQRPVPGTRRHASCAP